MGYEMKENLMNVYICFVIKFSQGRGRVAVVVDSFGCLSDMDIALNEKFLIITARVILRMNFKLSNVTCMHFWIHK